jgi:hypothetical protein
MRKNSARDSERLARKRGSQGRGSRIAGWSATSASGTAAMDGDAGDRAWQCQY